MSGSFARRHRVSLLAAGGLVVLAIGAVYLRESASRSPAEAERDAALALAEHGPSDAARSALMKSLEANPDDPALLRAAVRVLPQTGAPPPEVEPFTARWCRAAPSDPEAFRARLAVLQQLHQKADAIEPAERVLALEPNDHNTRIQLADLYRSVGRGDASVREYNRLLEASPFPRAELLALLGRAEAARGNNAEAARVLDAALAAAPDHTSALMMRGIVYQQVGDDGNAVEVLRRARPRTPQERGVVLHHLALSLTRLGRKEEAQRAFDDLTKTQDAILHRGDAEGAPNDAKRQARAGRSLLAAGSPEEAAQGLEAALERIGPDREILAVLADCYDRLGAADQAKAARARAAALSP